MKNSEQSDFPLDYSKDGLGLTKREYFAGLAMQGILSGPIHIQLAHDGNPEIMLNQIERIVRTSLNFADELLEQLSS